VQLSAVEQPGEGVGDGQFVVLPGGQDLPGDDDRGDGDAAGHHADHAERQATHREQQQDVAQADGEIGQAADRSCPRWFGVEPVAAGLPALGEGRHGEQEVARQPAGELPRRRAGLTAVALPVAEDHVARDEGEHRGAQQPRRLPGGFGGATEQYDGGAEDENQVDRRVRQRGGQRAAVGAFGGHARPDPQIPQQHAAGDDHDRGVQPHLLLFAPALRTHGQHQQSRQQHRSEEQSQQVRG
jgi:hypothetical protein